MKKNRKTSPARLVLEFCNGDSLVSRLSRGINPLSMRLAVRRWNEGSRLLNRPQIIMLRRTDEQTGDYYLVKV